MKFCTYEFEFGGNRTACGFWWKPGDNRWTVLRDCPICHRRIRYGWRGYRDWCVWSFDEESYAAHVKKSKKARVGSPRQEFLREMAMVRRDLKRKKEEK